MKKRPRPVVFALPALALGVVLTASGCFTSYHTERRSAVVVFVNNPSIPPGVSLEVKPLQKELQGLLKAHDLRLSMDNKQAQWVAYVDATFPTRREDPLQLALVTVHHNPDREMVRPVPAEARRIQQPDHPSLRLAEQLERMAQSSSSSHP